MRGIFFGILLCISPIYASSEVSRAREDQLLKLKKYVEEAIQPSGLVRDSLVLNGPHYHPATPDAAGFVLLSLSALDHLGLMKTAEPLTIKILKAHLGDLNGVTPERSKNGHFMHFLDLKSGKAAGGRWDASYSPISTGLLVAGAKFAATHFGSKKLRHLSERLSKSVDFDAAIHPSLDGRVFLDVQKHGKGGGGTLTPWNEYMLAVSLAFCQETHPRADKVKPLWLDPETMPKAGQGKYETLTDREGRFASGFWVHQMHFFNGDFRHNQAFEKYFHAQKEADKKYSETILNEPDRYGLTAGVSPKGYQADRIGDHPHNVFSPAAVMAWGDLNSFMNFFQKQPSKDKRYRYGLVRESATLPAWVPEDAGLVDHLFLLFGIVESIDPNFFRDRLKGCA